MTDRTLTAARWRAYVVAYRRRRHLGLVAANAALRERLGCSLASWHALSRPFGRLPSRQARRAAGRMMARG